MFLRKKIAVIGLILGMIVGTTSHHIWAIGINAPVDLNRFHPALGEQKFVTLDLADVGSHLQMVPQLFLNYAYNPFIYTMGSQTSASIITNQLTADIGFAISLWNRVQIGLSLPVALYQSGDTMDNMGKPVFAPTINNPVVQGDLRLAVKVPFYRTDSFGIGMRGELYLPTGNANQYFGGRYPNGNVDLVLHAKYKDRVTFALNIGGHFASKESILNFSSGLALRYGVGAEVNLFKEGSTKLSLIGEFNGQTHTFNLDERNRASMEFLLTAKVQHNNWTIFAGGGPGIPSGANMSGAGTPDFRVYTGVQYSIRSTQKEVLSSTRTVAPPVVVATPPLPPPQVPMVQVGAQRLTLPERIEFDFDKSTIREKSFSILTQISDILKKYPLMKLRLDGHTDFMGNYEYNNKLSRQRVDSVRAWLVAQGIDAQRLTVHACGKGHPLDSALTDEAREKNRRVEFVITTTQTGQKNTQAMDVCALPTTDSYSISTQ